MKPLVFSIIVLAATPCFADSPCKDKRKALRESRKAVSLCNKSWLESIRTDAADPSDDCLAKQTAFIASVKELKVCRKEAKAKK